MSHTVHLAVGDKEAVVVVDGEAVDPAEVRFKAVADELGFVVSGLKMKTAPTF
jgi:hypothetical protein